jgi:hypothetical protein
MLRQLVSEVGRGSDEPLDSPCRGAPDLALDVKVVALLRLAALVGVGASMRSYEHVVHACVDAGASADEVIGTVIAVAPTVGLSRLVAAVPHVALGLGYDIDAALERLDPCDQIDVTPIDRPAACSPPGHGS